MKRNKLDILFENFFNTETIDSDAIIAFMEEMVTAKSVAFYNDERQARYRSINLVNFINTYIPDSRSITKNSLLYSTINGNFLESQSVDSSSFKDNSRPAIF